MVSKASPAIVTTASAAVTLGTTAPTLSDSAVVSGGYYETGSVVFTLSGPNGFSYSHTDTVSGNGTYTASDTLPTTGVVAGTYTWTVHYGGDSNNNAASDQGGTAEQTVVSPAASVTGSIYVLDPTAGGALTLSGNASINVPGGVFVDSSSTSASDRQRERLGQCDDDQRVWWGPGERQRQLKASTAGTLLVKSGIQKSGNATDSPTPTTGAVLVSDPLSGLPAPTGGASQTAVNLSGNGTLTISPGIYSQINVSGNANLTLKAGIYVIAGGGFSVSGNAAVTGSGVLIYNTASTYNSTSGADASGGTYGNITLSGNGALNLTAASTGPYAGILIFQSRDNAKAVTISGNAMQGMTGAIYAKTAQLAESGNAQVGSASSPVSIVVDTLTLSGNAIANALSLSSPAGTVAYTPAQIRAAYGINNLSLDGTGQTIAIVDAYDDPAIYQALDAFDTEFGLTSSGPSLYSQYGPASSFLTVLNQNGQSTSLPATDPNGAGTNNWEVEEALDVEWIHAIAPGAQIVLVEANSQSLSDLMAGVATAAEPARCVRRVDELGLPRRPERIRQR